MKQCDRCQPILQDELVFQCEFLYVFNGLFVGGIGPRLRIIKENFLEVPVNSFVTLDLIGGLNPNVRQILFVCNFSQVVHRLIDEPGIS